MNEPTSCPKCGAMVMEYWLKRHMTKPICFKRVRENELCARGFVRAGWVHHWLRRAGITMEKFGEVGGGGKNSERNHLWAPKWSVHACYTWQRRRGGITFNLRHLPVDLYKELVKVNADPGLQEVFLKELQLFWRVR